MEISWQYLASYNIILLGMLWISLTALLRLIHAAIPSHHLTHFDLYLSLEIYTRVELLTANSTKDSVFHISILNAPSFTNVQTSETVASFVRAFLNATLSMEHCSTWLSMATGLAMLSMERREERIWLATSHILAVSSGHYHYVHTLWFKLIFIDFNKISYHEDISMRLAYSMPGSLKPLWIEV